MPRALANPFGPVFAREAVEIARRRRFYFNRCLYGAALFVILLVFWDEYGGRFQSGGSRAIRAMAQAASELFLTVNVLQFGAVFIPRIGHEVIVEFLDGNPDNPVVVGSLYNSANLPPYALPANKTQSGIKTKSTLNGGADNYNELKFEDKKGSELINVQAEKDLNTLVKNDETTTVRHNRSTVVLNDDLEVVVGFHTQNVGKDRTVAVLQNQMHAIKKNVVQHSLEGFAYHKSKQFTLIESDEQIILKVGDKSFIRILPEGIVIQGPKVLINPNEGE